MIDDWASNDGSIKDILIAAIGALLVGVFALPVVLVLDLIGTIRGLSTAKRAAAR